MSEYWLQISAGQGPAECQWVVERLTGVLCAEAADAGLSTRLVETTYGEGRLPRSVLIALAGNGSDTFAEAVQGTVQWIGASPFRPKHKRKNWFVGVFALPPPGESALLDERDVSFKPTKASGPGGQHVNKTESAVRAIHEPTGVSTVAQDERSQHANKRLALVKLAALLMQREADDQASHAQDRWQHHQGVERGNPVRIYEGTKFRRRKAR